MIIDENKKAGSGLYFTVQLKFVVAFIGTCFWAGFSIWIAQDWIDDLSNYIGQFAAIFLYMV
ncbi:hypothetical protein DCL20_01490 [Acinetobacter schindleri]|nr:hypothetical protein DCL20_01490 [Acinetobacter schindleri]